MKRRYLFVAQGNQKYNLNESDTMLVTIKLVGERLKIFIVSVRGKWQMSPRWIMIFLGILTLNSIKLQ